MADISKINSDSFKDSTLRTTISNLVVKSTYLNVTTTAKDNISLDNYKMEDGPQTVTTTFGITKSGYTPIGIVGYNIANATTNGVSGSYCELSTFYLSSTTQATVRLSTMAPANGTKVKITLYVLYRKN